MELIFVEVTTNAIRILIITCPPYVGVVGNRLFYRVGSFHFIVIGLIISDGEMMLGLW